MSPRIYFLIWNRIKGISDSLTMKNKFVCFSKLSKTGTIKCLFHPVFHVRSGGKRELANYI